MSKSTVFISYSHKDEIWKDRLKPYLGMIEKAGLDLVVWDDRKIDVGEKWYPEIEQAMRNSSFAVCLISPDYLNSDFCLKEEIPFLLERNKQQGMKIFPLLIRPCVWEIYPWVSETQMFPRDGKSIAEDYDQKWDGVFTDLARTIVKIIKDPQYQPPLPTAKWSPPEKVEIGRLPQTPYELFGRKNELKILDEAWETEETNIVCFVAWGGVGKSTLVNKWLEYLKTDNYRGAKRVFAWLFYSQGTGERVTSADLFIKEALVWFGDKNPEAGSPWDKGKRLAQLIRQDKTLLILDGLEPLQSYLDVEKGKIKDPALAVLVTELAKNNNGLCIITTREEIPDIRRFSSSARQVNLEQISDEAGRALLRVRGIRGTDAELESVTRAFGNHALAINLLAEYLHQIPGRPCQKAHDIPDLDIPEEQGKHPRRVIEAFAVHFGEGAELELLHILGLFDRPADNAAIDAVIQGEPIPGLTDQLHQISEGQWLKLLQKLRDTKLITPENHHRIDTIDCHPLIRENFSENLRAKSQQAWKQANSRLYEYFKNLLEKELPDTLEEMEPLFMAVVHGCRAAKHQEILDDIFWKRIRKGNEQFSYHKLGAFGSDTSVLSNFFESLWIEPVIILTEADKAWVLSTAGFGLRALGRLLEAAQPMKTSLEMLIKNKDWKNAAIGTCNLSELYLTLGNVVQAVAFGRQIVKFADKSGDEFMIKTMHSRAADAIYQSGNLSEANILFLKAEEILKKYEKDSKYLYTISGFQFCDLLLSQGQVEEVLKRANEKIKIAIRNNWFLDIALDKLSLGWAYLLQAATSPSVPLQRGKTMEQTADYLNQAVDGLRKAGTQHHIPRGLFAREELYSMQKDFSSAWEDLEEAYDIAERGEMRLWLTDYHLGAPRVVSRQLAVSSQQSSVGSYQVVEDGRLVTLNREEMVNRLKMHLENAKELVSETGYHRRDPELLLLQAQLHFASGDKANARIWLNKAKQRFDEMGIRMWDFEVRELEQAIG